MNVRYLLLLILLIPVYASAQGPYTSQKLWFEVDEFQGCASFTITITNIGLVHPCSGSEPCQISWGDGVRTPVTSGSTFSHTYTAAGNYILEVNYSAVGPDVMQVNVFQNIQPAFEVYTCNGNNVQVRVTDTNYDSYFISSGGPETEIPRGSAPIQHVMASNVISVRGKNANSDDNCSTATKTIDLPLPPFAHGIDELRVTNGTTIDLNFDIQPNVLYRLEVSTNGGAFQNLGNFVDTNTRSVSSLNTNANYYCFRLGEVNPCLGTIDYSPTICSAILTATAQNNANNLTWITSTAGVNNFTIVKDGVPLTPTTSATSFLDNTVDCGVEYQYQIVSNYANATSFSAIRTVTAISTDIPNPIDEISSVVNGNQVTLSWQEDATFDAVAYTIFRESNGNTPNQIANNITTLQYTDENYSSDNNYCYLIHYEDVCGNTSSAADATCPIVLTYTTNSNDEIVLTWDPYNGWISGVQRYELYKYDLQHNQVGTPIPITTGTTFTDTDLGDQGYYYVVRAIPVDTDNAESVSNEVLAVRGLRFAYPKAFTPDNQGPTENETFKVFVTVEFIDRFDMKIFNRWGELIFSTTDLLKGWDGRFNGSPQPEGTYTFVATLKDKAGRTYKRDGAVMLLRKK